MNSVRFEVKGFVNSFRIPFFRTYHRTFFAPPKTTIIGMLCNISLKPQEVFFEILDKEMIDVSVVINSIGGEIKDLWSYKTLEKSNNRGKSVIRRDKLFMPSYTIYLQIQNDELFKEILVSLKNPKNTPSLGLDDELITIKNITLLDEQSLVKNDTNIINSIFLNKNIKYKIHNPGYGSPIELPTPNLVPTKFAAFDSSGNRISKEIKEEFLQVEYINCEMELLTDIPSFKDTQTGKGIVFY